MKCLIFFTLVSSSILFLSTARKEITQNEKSTGSLTAANGITYCAPSFDPAKMDAGNAPLFNGLGDLHYNISTTSTKAQRYFDQGLTLLYAFNHGEAGRSFKAAIRHDSTCAMPYWGLAMVLGPNYNAPLDPSSLVDINDAINKAIKYSAKVSASEKALINALRLRFPEQEVKDMSAYNQSYVAAMKVAHEQFPNDVNIAALYADAMMNEHPWDLWLRDGTPQPWTPVIVETIEKLLAGTPDHVGGNHMYIHVMEASPEARKALPSADKLRDMLPAAGHIVHMPSHIYIRTGSYHKGVLANKKATVADSSYIAQCKVQGIYPMMYYPHNIHFLAACAFLEGNSKLAIEAAWSVARHADKTYINENAAIQHYSIIPYYVLVQTGKWTEILLLQQPDTSLRYPLAVWHYARGMAFAARNEMDAAANELTALQEIGKEQKLKTLLIWDINSAAQLTQIAADVLSGEIHSKQGRFDEAIQFLNHAKEIEDGLMYQEPPDWFFSTRHTLGHILLKAKKFGEAENVYKEDMVTYPENGWALMGLHKSLLGQHKNKEANAVLKRFNKAWKWADVRINSSRI